jgi:hypothetical protein
MEFTVAGTAPDYKPDSLLILEKPNAKILVLN